NQTRAVFLQRVLENAADVVSPKQRIGQRLIHDGSFPDLVCQNDLPPPMTESPTAKRPIVLGWKCPVVLGRRRSVVLGRRRLVVLGRRRLVVLGRRPRTQRLSHPGGKSTKSKTLGPRPSAKGDGEVRNGDEGARN